MGCVETARAVQIPGTPGFSPRYPASECVYADRGAMAGMKSIASLAACLGLVVSISAHAGGACQRLDVVQTLHGEATIVVVGSARVVQNSRVRAPRRKSDGRPGLGSDGRPIFCASGGGKLVFELAVSRQLSGDVPAKGELTAEAERDLYVCPGGVRPVAISGHMTELKGDLSRDRVWILHRRQKDGSLVLRERPHCVAAGLEEPLTDIIRDPTHVGAIARKHRALLLRVVRSAPDPQSIRVALDLLARVPPSEEIRQLPPDTTATEPVIECLTRPDILVRRDAREYLIARAERNISVDQIRGFGKMLVQDHVTWKDETAGLLTAVVRVPAAFLTEPSGADIEEAYRQRYLGLGKWIAGNASRLAWNSRARKYVVKSVVSERR